MTIEYSAPDAVQAPQNGEFATITHDDGTVRINWQRTRETASGPISAGNAMMVNIARMLVAVKDGKDLPL